MSEQQIDPDDIQQDSPAEAEAEVTDPDGQTDDDIEANRTIIAPLAGGQSGGVVIEPER